MSFTRFDRIYRMEPWYPTSDVETTGGATPPSGTTTSFTLDVVSDGVPFMGIPILTNTLDIVSDGVPFCLIRTS